jgi:hypothetical protein
MERRVHLHRHEFGSRLVRSTIAVPSRVSDPAIEVRINVREELPILWRMSRVQCAHGIHLANANVSREPTGKVSSIWHRIGNVQMVMHTTRTEVDNVED